jgi:hypothetical protein
MLWPLPSSMYNPYPTVHKLYTYAYSTVVTGGGGGWGVLDRKEFLRTIVADPGSGAFLTSESGMRDG